MDLGEKKIETRSWATNYGGLLAIHSAKRKLGYNERELIGHAHMELGINIDYNPPLGMVLCVVNLIDCVKTQLTVGGIRADFFETHGAKHESLFGDYTPGRYAWITEMVWNSPYVIGYPATGHQGLWDWEVHGYIVNALRKYTEAE